MGALRRWRPTTETFEKFTHTAIIDWTRSASIKTANSRLLHQSHWWQRGTDLNPRSALSPGVKSCPWNGAHGRLAADMPAKRTTSTRRGRAANVTSSTPDTIPNQVFLAIPWRTVRRRYERVVERLRTKSPLFFVIVGRTERQDADDLLEVIKERMASSSYAIFDATGGNPNVSLEYGYAEAQGLQRALYISTHGAATKGASDPPIIADLAGKRRNQYKQENGLSRLLHDFSRTHPYTVRFERFLTSDFRQRTRGTKKRKRALALKVIHALDGERQIRRADLVQRLQADPSRYTSQEIDDMIRRLHNARLLRSQQGPHARVHLL